MRWPRDRGKPLRWAAPGSRAARSHPFRALVVASLAAVVLACGPTIHVETTQATSARFARYHTFAFETDAGSPTDFAPSPRSAYVRARIEQIAEPLLESKGYLLAAVGPADLTIRVSSGRRERELRVPVPNESRFARRPDERKEDVVEGSFGIDAIDVATGELVWHGSARLEVQPDQVNEERLRRAVNEVLAALPAR